MPKATVKKIVLSEDCFADTYGADGNMVAVGTEEFATNETLSALWEVAIPALKEIADICEREASGLAYKALWEMGVE